MKRTRRSIWSLLPPAGVTAVLLAQAPPAIEVRYGLWEIATTIEIGGAPPSVDTTRMTPEQKAKAEAAWKALLAPRTSTDKQCLTKEEIADSFGESDSDEKCKDAITANTNTVYEVKRTCSGGSAETSLIHIEAVTREAIKGTVVSTATEDGRLQKVNLSFTGRFLGADCGTIK